MTTFVSAAALVVRKDLLVETRSREVVYTSLLFAISCMLVFAFGLVKEGRVVADAAAAILWITIAFAGTLALGRIFDRERQNETMRALLLAPAPRAAIYVGKLVGVVLLLLLVEAVVVPLVALMFDAPLFRHAAMIGGLLLAGSLGYAAVGTLFAAMLARSRSRGALLPVLLYPMTVPVIIGGVRGTAALLQPEADLAMARAWLVLLVCFDALFVTLALWIFEPVMTE
jgi:heme exporter protein CcmB